MPKIPTPSRTISQLVERQLPQFVRKDYPQFIAFLKAYYEWMEMNGTDVYAAKIVSATANTVTFPDTASKVFNDYQDMSLIVLNGVSKGYTRKIRTYDSATLTATVTEAWNETDGPLPNTRIVIRDTMFPNKLLQYRDIDTTLDKFVDYFRDEFLYQLPGTILADKRNILKHIKQFYQARGTENSFRFLFRILFDEEVEFYYPKVDLFRASDARWTVDYLMRVTTSGNTFDWLNRQIVGVNSGATANVESVNQTYLAGQTITELHIANIKGAFTTDSGTGEGELLKILYPFVPPAQSLANGPIIGCALTYWKSASLV